MSVYVDNVRIPFGRMRILGKRPAAVDPEMLKGFSEAVRGSPAPSP